MVVPGEVWETVALIINNEFVETGEHITPKLLVDLIKGVNDDYVDDGNSLD